MEYYKDERCLIYNPVGEDRWFITNKNIYIQGKPSNLAGFNVNEIIVTDRLEMDIEWFDKNIKPFGIVNDVIVEYKQGGK